MSHHNGKRKIRLVPTLQFTCKQPSFYINVKSSEKLESKFLAMKEKKSSEQVLEMSGFQQRRGDFWTYCVQTASKTSTRYNEPVAENIYVKALHTSSESFHFIN